MITEVTKNEANILRKMLKLNGGVPSRVLFPMVRMAKSSYKNALSTLKEKKLIHKIEGPGRGKPIVLYLTEYGLEVAHILG